MKEKEILTNDLEDLCESKIFMKRLTSTSVAAMANSKIKCSYCVQKLERFASVMEKQRVASVMVTFLFFSVKSMSLYAFIVFFQFRYTLLLKKKKNLI